MLCFHLSKAAALLLGALLLSTASAASTCEADGTCLDLPAAHGQIQESVGEASNMANPNTPSLQNLEAPTLQDSKAPNLQSPEAPSLQSLEAPSLQSSKAPSLQNPEAPSLQSPEVPSPHNPEAPSLQNPEAPSLQSSKAPSLHNPEASSLQSPEVPSSHNPEAPSLQSSKAPSLQNPEAPSLQSPEIPSPHNPEAPSLQNPEAPSLQSPEAPSLQNSTAPSLQNSTAPSLQNLKAPSLQNSEAPASVLPRPFEVRKWYDDESCHEKPKSDFVTKGMEEAMEMARLSATYLEKGLPPDLQTVFESIFSPKIPDEHRNAIETVRNVMHGIASMQRTTSINEASVHIYCDDERRWTLNQNTEWHQDPIYEDLKSQMWEARPPSCHRIVACTYVLHRRIPTSLHTDRSSMTLCEPSFSDVESVAALIKNNVKDEQLYLFEMEYITSRLLLHELMHTIPYDMLDIEPAYGWVNVLNNPYEDGLKNAENYAYFGLLVLLFEKGYKLDNMFRGSLMRRDQSH